MKPNLQSEKIIQSTQEPPLKDLSMLKLYVINKCEYVGSTEPLITFI